MKWSLYQSWEALLQLMSYQSDYILTTCFSFLNSLVARLDSREITELPCLSLWSREYCFLKKETLSYSSWIWWIVKISLGKLPGTFFLHQVGFLLPLFTASLLQLVHQPSLRTTSKLILYPQCIMKFILECSFGSLEEKGLMPSW